MSRHTTFSHVATLSHLREELSCDGLQGLLGPGSEPVDGGVVDQPREVAAASLEQFSDGRHAEDNVEVARTLLDEEGPHTLFCGGTTRLDCLVTNLEQPI